MYGWPLSACQTWPVAVQLSAGVRVLDVRLSLPDGPQGTLKAYHGIQNQYMDFATILRQVYGFLDAHPTEVVVMSIKQEDKTDGFEAAVYAAILIDAERWWTAPLMPTLGDVRGKIVLFSRFGHRPISEPFPCRFPASHPDRSPWQMVFIRQCGQTTARTSGRLRYQALISPCKIGELQSVLASTASDSWPRRYDIGSIVKLPEKAILVERSLGLASPSEPSRPWLFTFLSASSLLFAFPNICAKGYGFPSLGLGVEGINSRIARWFTDGASVSPETKIKGAVVLVDFIEYPDNVLVPLLVDCNF